MPQAHSLSAPQFGVGRLLAFGPADSDCVRNFAIPAMIGPAQIQENQAVVAGVPTPGLGFWSAGCIPETS